MPRHIAVYISGHGYGHLSQIAPVLNRLHELAPDTHYLLRTALPEPLVARRLAAPFTLLPGAVDVGVIQKDAVSEDIPATIDAARAFYTDLDARIEAEVAQLTSAHPVAVLADISPLAFPVAERLGLPSFAVASLDWHDIYRHYLPADDPLLDMLADAHALCDLLIQPPLSMPMPTFPRREQVEVIVDDAWTVRRNLPSGRKVALVMFGGAGDPPYDIQALGTMHDWTFHTLSPVPAGAPANIHQVAPKDGSTAALMHGCDVVVTKPGYGTLAEAWQTKTPVVYIPREAFPEYPFLDAWLETHAPSSRMPMEDFVAGRWRDAMESALACTRSWPVSEASGATQAAALVRDRLETV